VSGTIKLQAGIHPVRLTYRHTTGVNLLSLKYAGPGISKQPVPLSAFSALCSNCITAPMAQDDYATTTQNTPVMIDALANDLDDGFPNPLSITNIAQPLAGTATLVSGQIRYAPNTNFLGDDSFTYAASDGAFQSSATVHVSVGFVDGNYWFPFNEVAGFTTKEAGGYTTAQLQGFSNDPNQWVSGRFNRAISFDGTNDFVMVPGFNGVSGAGARTCAAWVKTTRTNGMPVIAWGTNASGNSWTFLLQSGMPRVEVTGGWVQGSHSVNDGQWHHIACTFTNDGSPNVTDLKLYVDGFQETSFSSQSPQAINTLAVSAVTIGSDAQGRFFNGVIDEVQIYSRALSASEITNLVAATNQSAAAWYRRYFGNAAINWGADDDADGLNRFAEYAFGGQPLIADSQLARIAYVTTNGYFQVKYHRRTTGTHELTYQLQSSSDLKNWSALSGIETSVVPSTTLAGFEDVIFQSQAQIGAASPAFVRLKVTSP